MNALFIPFNLKSHIISTFGFAGILKNNGYCITIASSEQYLELINSNNFSSYELNGFPYGYGFEQVNREIFENSENLYLDELIDRIGNRIYVDRYQKINLMINKLNPKVIFIDVFCSTDLIILSKIFTTNTKVKIAFFQGSFKNVDDLTIPPIDCPYHPSQKFKTIFFSLRKNLMFRSKIIFDYVKYLTRSDYSIIRKSLKNSNIKRISKVRFHRIHFHDFSYFVFCYEELDYSRDINNNHFYYIGNSLSNNSISLNFDKTQLLSKLSDLKYQRQAEKKIIYFSLGTILLENYTYDEAINNFIQQVIGLSNQDNLIIVCSLGKMAKLFNSKENLFVYESVRQNDILKIADVFISHGGTGSILESVINKVPMILYDFNKIYDHKGNISKCLYNGIGISGNYKIETTVSINLKIQVLLNEDTYKQNLDALNSKISKNRNYTEKEILKKVCNLEYM